MKARHAIDMAEVTRLTREGQLAEAMALLCGASEASPVDVAITDRLRSSSVNGAKVAARTRVPHALAPMTLSRTPAPPVDALRASLATRLKPRVRMPVADGFGSRQPVPVPPGARFELRHFTNAAGSRSYKLYVPASYTGAAAPLVVMLHGCTQSPDDFARGTRMNELAEECGWLIAWPAQSKSASSSGCWNWFNPADQQRGRGEPALIAGITREVMRDFAVDPARVYVAGLSAGGAMAAILGAAYPDLYAAVGVHSGLARGVASDMTSAFSAMRSGGVPIEDSIAVPTIIFHGDADTTVNPVNGLQVAAQALGAETMKTTTSEGTRDGGLAWTRRVNTTAAGRPMLEQWLLHGAGHAWSGGSAAGSFVEPRGPDASRAMLHFFSAHALARTPGLQDVA